MSDIRPGDLAVGDAGGPAGRARVQSPRSARSRGDGKVGEEVGRGQGGLAVADLGRQDVAGEEVSPAEGRVEAGEGQAGVRPRLGAERRAGGSGVSRATRRGTATTASASPARRAKANRCAGLRALGGQGDVLAGGEEPGVVAPAGERRWVTYSLIRPSSLEATVPGPAPAGRRRRSRWPTGAPRASGAALVVHRSAVVGVDQAEVPELGPLVRVRRARRRQLEQRLRQRVEQAIRGDPALEGAEVVEEGAVASSSRMRPTNVTDGLVVLGVGVDPARVHLGLVQRLEHVVLDPLDERRAFLGPATPSGQAPTSVW